MERTVERAVQIISEAVRALPAELTERHPEIEWEKIASIGNILRHEYQRVDPAKIMMGLAPLDPSYALRAFAYPTFAARPQGAGHPAA
jgi:Ribonuclease HepT-like